MLTQHQTEWKNYSSSQIFSFYYEIINILAMLQNNNITLERQVPRPTYVMEKESE